MGDFVGGAETADWLVRQPLAFGFGVFGQDFFDGRCADPTGADGVDADAAAWRTARLPTW